MVDQSCIKHNEFILTVYLPVYKEKEKNNIQNKTFFIDNFKIIAIGI
jgi:hypothetical protein